MNPQNRRRRNNQRSTGELSAVLLVVFLTVDLAAFVVERAFELLALPPRHSIAAVARLEDVDPAFPPFQSRCLPRRQ